MENKKYTKEIKSAQLKRLMYGERKYSKDCDSKPG